MRANAAASIEPDLSTRNITLPADVAVDEIVGCSTEVLDELGPTRESRASMIEAAAAGVGAMADIFGGEGAGEGRGVKWSQEGAAWVMQGARACGYVEPS